MPVNTLLVQFLFLLTVFGMDNFAAELQGRYSKKVLLREMTTNKLYPRTNFLNISKSKDTYLLKGELFGGNVHVCTLEGETGPLHLKKVLGKNVLEYKYSEKEYDLACHLRLSFEKNKVILSDSNHDCHRMLACGVHAGIDGIELYKEP